MSDYSLVRTDYHHTLLKRIPAKHILCLINTISVNGITRYLCGKGISQACIIISLINATKLDTAQYQSLIQTQDLQKTFYMYLTLYLYHTGSLSILGDSLPRIARMLCHTFLESHNLCYIFLGNSLRKIPLNTLQLQQNFVVAIFTERNIYLKK
jgi:hypothetical protein